MVPKLTSPGGPRALSVHTRTSGRPGGVHILYVCALRLAQCTFFEKPRGFEKPGEERMGSTGEGRELVECGSARTSTWVLAGHSFNSWARTRQCTFVTLLSWQPPPLSPPLPTKDLVTPQAYLALRLHVEPIVSTGGQVGPAQAGTHTPSQPNTTPHSSERGY